MIWHDHFLMVFLVNTCDACTVDKFIVTIVTNYQTKTT